MRMSVRYPVPGEGYRCFYCDGVVHPSVREGALFWADVPYGVDQHTCLGLLVREAINSVQNTSNNGTDYGE